MEHGDQLKLVGSNVDVYKGNLIRLVCLAVIHSTRSAYYHTHQIYPNIRLLPVRRKGLRMHSACRKKQLEGVDICGLATYKFRSRFRSIKIVHCYMQTKISDLVRKNAS